MNPYADIDPEEFAARDHGNRFSETIGIGVLCMTVATIVVLVRLYTKHYILNQLWLDDYLAAAALVGTLTCGIIQCIQTKYGLGYHIWDLPDFTGFVMYFKLLYAISIMYNVTLLLIKFSLFFQYYRLVKEIPRYSVAYLVIMGLVGCWSIVQILLIVFACFPIQGYWDLSVPSKCIGHAELVWMTSGGNIATDVIVLLLPMPVVWKLNLKKGRKWAILGIFSLGFFTCAISITRLVAYAVMGEDFTYDMERVIVWALVEMTSGLLCSVLIAIRPILRGLLSTFKPGGQSATSFNIYTMRVGSRSRNPQNPGLGSETELTCHDELDRANTFTKKVSSNEPSGDSLGSLCITPSWNTTPGQNTDSPQRNDRFLGLKSGVQTVISSGRKENMDLDSPTEFERMSPLGIVVKQAWSIQDRETTGEISVPQPTFRKSTSRE
ncbi:hypothetical protein F4775DRAFT_578575 [Biscogniauxia sp. FL1348]|nr:hypothetical protein F4775DRAFT_578575 [Biscogniauxia sp. FL1348]